MFLAAFPTFGMLPFRIFAEKVSTAIVQSMMQVLWNRLEALFPLACSMYCSGAGTELKKGMYT